MEKLPKNWVFVPMEDLGAQKYYAIGDGDHGKIKPSMYQEAGIPYIRVGDMGWGEFKKDKLVFIPEEVHKENLKSELLPGDVLIAKTGATIGKCCIVPEEIKKANTTSSVGKVSPNFRFTSSKYILYYFLSPGFFQLMWSHSNRTAQPGFNNRDLKKFPVPLAPRAEQQRIVAKLDGLFGHLEQVKARLDKVPQLLKNFRQAILDKEFSVKRDRMTIGELCNKVQDGAHHSPKNQYTENDGSKFLYITSKNIRNNYMKLDKIVYVDKEFHDSIYSRCTPEFGDVLLTKDGANTGNVTLNTLKEPFSLLSSVCLIKPKKELLIPAYLKYYIQSPAGFKELTGEMTGTAIKRIILRKIKNATIPVPSIREQTEIVRRVEQLFAKADKIEAAYIQLKQKVDNLPQAILAKAFKGELVEQLPTDGDAKELLKEIAALKAAAVKGKKKGRK